MASASTTSKARHFGNGAPVASSSTGLPPPSTSHQNSMINSNAAPQYKAERPRAAGGYASYPSYDYSFQQAGSSSGGGAVGGNGSGAVAYPQYATMSAQLPGGGGYSTASNAYNTYLGGPEPQYQQQSQGGNYKQEPTSLDGGGAWGGDGLHGSVPYPSTSQDLYGYDYDPSFQPGMPMGRQPYHPPSTLLPPQARTPPPPAPRGLPQPSGRPVPTPSSPVKTRPKPAEKIPRPPNAWILYRSDVFARLKAGGTIDNITPLNNKGKGGKGLPQSDISKQVSKVWKAEPPEVRAMWEEKARIAKAEHEKLHPGYKFQPKRKEEKLAEKAARDLERENKKRSKDSRSTQRGAARRRRGRSPTTDGDYHPYHLAMARSSSYSGSTNHPPEHRAGEFRGWMPVGSGEQPDWKTSRLGYPMEGMSESEDERKTMYPYAPSQSLPLGPMDAFPMPGGSSQKATPTSSSPPRTYASLPTSNLQPQQQEWLNPPPEPAPITNFPPFSPFRPAEGGQEVKATTVPYLFKPINAQSIMLPAEYAPLTNDYLVDDEDTLASTWVDLAQNSTSTTPGNEQGFASFTFENIADPEAWTAHENAHLPIPSNMISPNVREFIEKGWDAQKSSTSEMYVGLPADYEYTPEVPEDGPVLPAIPLSPVDTGVPSGWMSPTSALAPPRTFSETFPGLDSQILGWGESFNENDISGALETLDSIPAKPSAASPTSVARSTSASAPDRSVSGASQASALSSTAA